MEKILVSACLLGQAVRYDGGDQGLSEPLLERWLSEGRVVPLCPEIAGGLSVPRRPAEIVSEVPLRLLNDIGEDVTEAFTRGAETALELAQQHGIHFALLKESSPSCGPTWRYDGRFQRRKIPGQGVTARVLREHGIVVFNETELEQLAAAINRLEC